MGHLKEKVAIVTGAGRGIGKGIAECFISEGATVIIATVEYEEGSNAEQELREKGGNAAFIQTDVSSEESIKNMIQETINRFGKIDILVNNAGITTFKPIEDTTIDDWDRLINIDLRGPFLCSKYVLPHMKKQKHGSIINISSNHSIATLPNTEIYAAAKGGVNAMTKSMALSLGKNGIRVNSICPGFTDTPHYRNWLLDNKDPSIVHNDVLLLHPLNKICSPKDIGKLAVYLSSEESQMITGQNIVIDGGVTSRLYNSEKF
ncbi:SDR family NAD(P)-dependent oxidoreductase [Lederbergia citri]|uniref:Glucose 1-dehydrogenase n=1 Tax=Lederbergia citri TaxID=2833580 RepID=A0A942YJ57_9BACI|nr:glucose 1-dehydrogenase [Lederbergia citri]MBS4197749.1 glucose 1-dehydrogenase [Lederbergia citri]